MLALHCSVGALRRPVWNTELRTITQRDTRRVPRENPRPSSPLTENHPLEEWEPTLALTEEPPSRRTSLVTGDRTAFTCCVTAG